MKRMGWDDQMISITMDKFTYSLETDEEDRIIRFKRYTNN
jgi:hypothetical protein